MIGRERINKNKKGMVLDIVMGLMAALCWGVTDYLVGRSARAFGVRQSVLLGQLIGLLVLTCILAVSVEGFSFLRETDLIYLVLSALAGLSTIAGALAISSAFFSGRTSIVAPLVTSYGVFTTLLAWWSGEAVSVLQFVGLVICASGVAFVGLGNRASGSTSPVAEGRAILFALLAAVLYGVSFWLQGVYALPVIGPVNMLWTSYLIGVVVLWPVTYKTLALRSRGLRAYAALCGASLSNLGGFTAFSYGVVGGSVAIVTVISTLSGGVAAALGYLFYRERMTAMQLVGICLVLGGAMALHLAGKS